MKKENLAPVIQIGGLGTEESVNCGLPPACQVSSNLALSLQTCVPFRHSYTRTATVLSDKFETLSFECGTQGCNCGAF